MTENNVEINNFSMYLRMDIKFIELLINLVNTISILIHAIIKFRVYLFRRKVYLEKCFLYFSVFIVTKNDDQIKTFLV
jgi:hypothetical protein